MLTAIRRTLDVELAANPKLVVFGEDVGPKGGVHGATLGLQEKFGRARVFDTSLSEEGIIGRAVGHGVRRPRTGCRDSVSQVRRSGRGAAERLRHDALAHAQPVSPRRSSSACQVGSSSAAIRGTARRTKWPGLHGVGWRVAMPSNAEDAVGLLRAAMRGNDPTIFFEHRAMLDGMWARRPYPGDDFVVPFGVARRVRTGRRAHARDLGRHGGAV